MSYIRVFKSRQSSHSYTLSYSPSLDVEIKGRYYLTSDYPYDHESVQVEELELYSLFDTLFERAKNEKVDGQERREKDDERV